MTWETGGDGVAPIAARLRLTGLSAALAACLALAPAAVTGGTNLLVMDPEGEVLAELPLAADRRWCLHWAHSVTGGPVADCFRVGGNGMILERSFLHDFAAGLGTLPGRGTLRSAEAGGYWIEGIDVSLPDATLPLRVGRPGVDHRLVSGDRTLELSNLAPGRRVLIRPRTSDPKDRDPRGGD